VKKRASQGPEKPSHLTSSASEKWDAVVQELTEAGRVESVDAATLAAYCQAYGRWVEAETAIKAYGTLVKSKSGVPAPSPYLAVANKAMEQMKKLHSLIWDGPSGEKKQGLVTRAEAAARLGVAANRINKWVSDGAPVAVRGSRGHSAFYDLDALQAWVAERGRKGNQDEGLSLGAARSRLAIAQALKYERENLVRSGQLVERTQVVSEGQTVLAALRAKLLAVSRLAVMRGVVTRDNEAGLHSLIVDALRELARWNVGSDATAAGEAEA